MYDHPCQQEARRRKKGNQSRKLQNFNGVVAWLLLSLAADFYIHKLRAQTIKWQLEFYTENDWFQFVKSASLEIHFVWVLGGISLNFGWFLFEHLYWISPPITNYSFLVFHEIGTKHWKCIEKSLEILYRMIYLHGYKIDIKSRNFTKDGWVHWPGEEKGKEEGGRQRAWSRGRGTPVSLLPIFPKSQMLPVYRKQHLEYKTNFPR